MDCTFITFKDGQKKIIFWIDPMSDTRWIETYLYSPVSDEMIEEIKKVPTSRVQELLSKLF